MRFDVAGGAQFDWLLDHRKRVGWWLRRRGWLGFLWLGKLLGRSRFCVRCRFGRGLPRRSSFLLRWFGWRRGLFGRFLGPRRRSLLGRGSLWCRWLSRGGRSRLLLRWRCRLWFLLWNSTCFALGGKSRRCGWLARGLENLFGVSGHSGFEVLVEDLTQIVCVIRIAHSARNKRSGKTF